MAAGAVIAREVGTGQRGQRVGQYATPPAVARFMASLFEVDRKEISLLDPGAGAGVLTEAFVSEMCRRRSAPERLRVVAYECDGALARALRRTLGRCERLCRENGVAFSADVIADDFLRDAAHSLQGSLLDAGRRFDCAILNPPFAKIRADSSARRWLRSLGVEVSNLYAGFVAAALALLTPSGELVAITPRSFCSGAYFRAFRAQLLAAAGIRHLHLFESRRAPFGGDGVLQESLITHLVRPADRRGTVRVAVGDHPAAGAGWGRPVPYDRVVRPGDPAHVIHIPLVPGDDDDAALMGTFRSPLRTLGLSVSTGRVVEFRARDHLVPPRARGAVPLIGPSNCRRGAVVWPVSGARPQGIRDVAAADALLVPAETYVLVRRFSAKEERRRIVAAVYSPGGGEQRVGFENHLNYFHAAGRGVGPMLAAGLSAFLNSGLVDRYFRQFNGHTQVNAGDLMTLGYPSALQLEELGRKCASGLPDPAALDEELARMARRACPGQRDSPRT